MPSESKTLLSSRPVEAVERRVPPGHEQGERERAEKRGADGDPELGRDPAAAGDALRPREPVGAVLELEHERRREQDADQPRDEREPAEEAAEPLKALR